MKLKYAINLHKGATAFFVWGLMYYFHNWQAVAWVYLALHGSYGFMWLFKDRVFPDRQWEEKVSVPYAIIAFLALGLYWIAPVYIIVTRIEPPGWALGLGVALTVLGTLLHFGSDAQKHYTLLYRRGLITDGFFARCRNTNYLGELMIYCGFATLTFSWIGFIGITLFFAAVFIPNMLKKDKSLSRYPEFAAYKSRSGLIIPKLWPANTN
jgi:protein-S-isoprenylcysteine O-methyltransferase Ste14